MADDNSKAVFPVIPVTHWWALREKFKKTIPSVVNDSYIASVLNMSEKSARSNIIPSLKYMGIIDDDGKPTERAVKWRDDIHYSEVCAEIRKEIYPSALIEIASDPEQDKESAQRWFATTTRVGESGVRRLLSIYLLLTEADVSKSTGATKSSQQKRKSNKSENPSDKKTTSKKPLTLVNDSAVSSQIHMEHNPMKKKGSFSSTLNLNIQIHISSEAPPEQIDQIFESMAKHLKDLID